jgi:hypothetical protein
MTSFQIGKKWTLLPFKKTAMTLQGKEESGKMNNTKKMIR